MIFTKFAMNTDNHRCRNKQDLLPPPCEPQQHEEENEAEKIIQEGEQEEPVAYMGIGTVINEPSVQVEQGYSAGTWTAIIPGVAENGGGVCRASFQLKAGQNVPTGKGQLPLIRDFESASLKSDVTCAYDIAKLFPSVSSFWKMPWPALCQYTKGHWTRDLTGNAVPDSARAVVGRSAILGLTLAILMTARDSPKSHIIATGELADDGKKPDKPWGYHTLVKPVGDLKGKFGVILEWAKNENRKELIGDSLPFFTPLQDEGCNTVDKCRFFQIFSQEIKNLKDYKIEVVPIARLSQALDYTGTGEPHRATKAVKAMCGFAVAAAIILTASYWLYADWRDEKIDIRIVDHVRTVGVAVPGIFQVIKKNGKEQLGLLCSGNGILAGNKVAIKAEVSGREDEIFRLAAFYVGGQRKKLQNVWFQSKSEATGCGYPVKKSGEMWCPVQGTEKGEYHELQVFILAARTNSWVERWDPPYSAFKNVEREIIALIEQGNEGASNSDENFSIKAERIIDNRFHGRMIPLKEMLKIVKGKVGVVDGKEEFVCPDG